MCWSIYAFKRHFGILVNIRDAHMSDSDIRIRMPEQREAVTSTSFERVNGPRRRTRPSNFELEPTKRLNPFPRTIDSLENFIFSTYNMFDRWHVSYWQLTYVISTSDRCHFGRFSFCWFKLLLEVIRTLQGDENHSVFPVDPVPSSGNRCLG